MTAVRPCVRPPDPLQRPRAGIEILTPWARTIPTAFPIATVCASTQTVTSIASAALEPPDCYIPDVFAQNMAYCEAQLCQPIDWRQDLVYSNATVKPKAYDVCSWACSYYTLGTTMNQTTTGTAADGRVALQRSNCQDRCRVGGVDSFLCRVRT